jgi:hypothetical protein
VIERVAALVDCWVLRAFVERRFASARALERGAWLAEQADRMRALSERDWFGEPAPLVPQLVGRGRYRGIPTQIIQWDPPVLAAAQRLGIDSKLGAPRARHYAGGRDAIWILLHGWLGGNCAIDRRDWPMRALLRQYDVAQVVLPGHGPRRARRGSFLPSFPTRNPVANTLGLATATAELRQLIYWLKRRGYARVGIAATSIGAHIAALVATTDSACDRMLLDRPLARMSEPIRSITARRGAPYTELLARLEAVYACVDPLRRVARLDPTRIALLLGRADAIGGVESGRALAQHLNVEPTWFPGGHALAVGRRALLLPLLQQL